MSKTSRRVAIDNPSEAPLAALGEPGAIALFQRVLEEGASRLPRPLLGIGDDAAVWQPEAGRLAIETTDLLVEDVHFSLAYFSWFDVGWKAMAVNVSDIAAMGGRPRAAFVSAGLRAGMTQGQAADLYRGLASCATEYGCGILGGDTVSSPRAVVLNVALFGETLDSSGRFLRRDAARPGDAVAVTGPLGASAACLRLLESRTPPKHPHRQRESENDRPWGTGTPLSAFELPSALLAAHLRPRPRLREGQRLIEAGLECAMDVSDGLVGDLTKICRASGVGALLRLPLVPVSPDALRLLGSEQAMDLALTGGEDYEILACGPESTLRSLGLVIIGEIIEGKDVRVITDEGDVHTVEYPGYDAFR